jgi:TolB-like protein/DNA-binding winged helix-turn-helix (wHTH) protein/tetratricopeptide (TPR) repeat protein
MYVLGPAVLDTEKQVLTMHGRALALQRKPYLVLLYLIQNRHRMVYRKELLDQLWGGKEVYDQSLSKAVGGIRKAFGETRTSSMFIETRWGFGYRYVGPFSEESISEPVSRIEDSALSSSPVLPLPVIPPASSSSVESPLAAPSLNLTPPPYSSASLSRQLVAASLLLLLLIAVSSLAVFIFRARHTALKSASPSSLPSIRSVAVLPFATDTGSAEDAYLGLGLADAVAARLNTVGQLNVRSSSTVRAVLGPNPDASVAAKRLQVQAVVKGTLHRSGDIIAVTVEVIDGSSRQSLWFGNFQASSSNLFATEDPIARQISIVLLPSAGQAALKLPLTPDTTNPLAYNKYMKAEFFATARTQNSLSKAIDLLNEALLIDPKYGRAYAALANCYQLQGFYQFAAPAEAYRRSKDAARKALSIDNSIAEAHVSLLSALTDYDWDWQGAEREFNASVAIDPNFAVAYQYYGFALLGMGRGEEALAAMKHAADLDPVSPSVQTSLAWAYFLLRKDQEAADECEHALELYPDFVPAHQLLGIVEGQLRASQRAATELNQAEALERDSVITPILLDYEMARIGRQAEARRNLEGTLAQLDENSIPDYYVAAAWSAIGDKQRALDSLERAYRQHSNWVIYLQYDPRFDNLRSDPQFKSTVHQVRTFHEEALSARQ